MDKALEETLKKLYDRFSNEAEFSICSPEYTQQQIDVLISYGYITKIDASHLGGWEYIVRPTYAGQTYFAQKKVAKKSKLKHNIIEVVKFMIPTIISIVALIVSILK